MWKDIDVSEIVNFSKRGKTKDGSIKRFAIDCLPVGGRTSRGICGVREAVVIGALGLEEQWEGGRKGHVGSSDDDD